MFGGSAGGTFCVGIGQRRAQLLQILFYTLRPVRPRVAPLRRFRRCMYNFPKSFDVRFDRVICRLIVEARFSDVVFFDGFFLDDELLFRVDFLGLYDSWNLLRD